MSDALLSVRGLEAGYGGSQVLFGVDLDVGYGEVVSLLGRNGMGKTTTILWIMGLLPARAGEIRFAGRPLTRQPPFRIAQAGIGLVPEGRQVFPTLTVEENLIATASNRGGQAAPWTLERVYAFFPRLAERRRNYGDEISGGEQQMLAIGRALMANPRVLLLDEPSEGLAPQIVGEVMATIRRLKEQGLSIVLVEQNAKLVFDIADDIVILNSGRVVVDAPAAELHRDGIELRQHLGIY